MMGISSAKGILEVAVDLLSIFDVLPENVTSAHERKGTVESEPSTGSCLGITTQIRDTGSANIIHRPAGFLFDHFFDDAKILGPLVMHVPLLPLAEYTRFEIKPPLLTLPPVVSPKRTGRSRWRPLRTHCRRI
jgi:hypothetical protein